MGSIPQKTLNWLYDVLRAEYQDLNRTYADVAQALSQNPNLSPRTDVYTYENGRSALLLNIAGTLPVNFRGTNYMFPMSIWIPHEYPRAMPVNFVTPTRNMVIRPGQHITGEGRVFHPYLAGWREDRSSISEFLLILQEVFAREPPVVSKQEQIPQPAIPPRSSEIPPPIPPLPPELGAPRRTQPPLSPRSTPRPPQLPPKPFASRGQPQTATNEAPTLLRRMEMQYGLPQNGYQEYGAQVPPNLRQRSGSLHYEYIPNPANHQPIYFHNQEQRRDSYSPVSPLTPPRPLTPRQPVEVPTSSTQPPQRPYSFQGPPPPRLPAGAPGPDRSGYQTPHPQQNMYIYNSQNQLQKQPNSKPIEDLLTSPSETTIPIATPTIPPPIPPSPQKDALLSALSQTLTAQVHANYASNLAAIPPLQAQQSAIHTTLTAINQEIAQLNDLQSLLSSNEAILHQATRVAEKVTDDAKHRKVPSVDEVVVAPTVVAGQLYDLVADERSLEECRAVVVKALDRGRIGGDVWAKQTRSLARSEFLKKALIRKIARGMGLMEGLSNNEKIEGF